MGEGIEPRRIRVPSVGIRVIRGRFGLNSTTMPISETSAGTLIHLTIQPRASRTEVAGLHGATIRIRLAAPPVDGAANEALVRFLAETLGLPKSAITIKSGLSGKRKTVLVTGQSPDDVSVKLVTQPPR